MYKELFTGNTLLTIQTDDVIIIFTWFIRNEKSQCCCNIVTVNRNTCADDSLYRVFYLIFISAIVTVLQFSAYIFLPNA